MIVLINLNLLYAFALKEIICCDVLNFQMVLNMNLVCCTFSESGFFCRTGWLGPTMIIVFFLVSSVINKLVMNPIVPCVVYTEKCEGDLR